MAEMKKIRFYIDTHKHPLVSVELTGLIDVDTAIWDLMSEPNRRRLIEREFFKTVKMSFEEEKNDGKE